MSLKRFATNIRRRANTIEANVDQMTRQTAIVAQTTVIFATPVDEGRARNNWFASLQIPIETPVDDVDPDGQGRIRENISTIQLRKIGQDIWISNNVPYIRKLNEGSSAQAPANFVEKAVQTAVNYIKRQRVVS